MIALMRSLVAAPRARRSSIWLVAFALLACVSPAWGYGVELHPGAGGGRIIVGPDGNFWMTSGLGLTLADPAGTFLREIQTPQDLFSDPRALTSGPDGNVWYSGYGRVGRVTPSGSVVEFDVGPPAVTTVHPFPIPIGAITSGPDGNLWYTESGRNEIGRLTTSGVLTRFQIPSSVVLPFQPPTSSPQGIAVGPDGALWFTEMATNKIGRITTAGVITEFPLPTAGAGPMDIAAGPDGALWFTEESAAKIGRITTSGAVTEFAIPGAPAKRPSQIALGTDGALWFTWRDGDASQGGIGRIATTGAIAIYTTHAFNTALGLPSDVVLPADGSVWFATATIGRLVDVASVAPVLAAAVLPGGRSARVGQPVTVFATIVNAGASGALRCRPELATAIPSAFDYAPTDPATNGIVGPLNTPVDIPAAASQSFVLGFTPSAAFAPTEVALRFQCDNAAPVASVPGLDTLILSASATPVPDIIALAATAIVNDSGILTAFPAPAVRLFSAATANLGASGRITVSVDTGAQSLPLQLAICPNDPQARCLVPFAQSVQVDMPAGGTTSFIVQASATAPIPLDPAHNRIFIRFTDETGALRAVTSVAVQSPAFAFTF